MRGALVCVCVYDFRVQSETSRSPQFMYVQVQVYTYWSSTEQVLLEVAYIHERTCIVSYVVEECQYCGIGCGVCHGRAQPVSLSCHSGATAADGRELIMNETGVQ